MLKCVHVSAGYPPAIGGAENYCATVSESLAGRGYRIEVFTSRLRSRFRWQNELPPHAVVNSVRVRRFGVLPRGPITWRWFHWSQRGYAARPRPIYELGLMMGEGPVCPGLAPALTAQRTSTTVVHVFGLYSAMAWYTAVLANWLRIPLVITPFTHREAHNLDMAWKQRALAGAASVIAMTHQERGYLIEEIGLDPRRVHVVSPALDLAHYAVAAGPAARARLGLDQTAFVVLFLGRQEENKELATLLAACSGAARRGREAFTLVLAGPKTPYAERLLREPPANVVNLGEVDEAAKLDALNACDCLVLPSRSESFGIVLLEAWAVGKPVIAAESAATTELVAAGRDGFLFPVGNAEILADRLTLLLDQPGLARELGQNGRQRVLTKHVSEALGEKMAAVYESIARRG